MKLLNAGRRNGLQIWASWGAMALSLIRFAV
jgi:hypothetical protein